MSMVGGYPVFVARIRLTSPQTVVTLQRKCGSLSDCRTLAWPCTPWGLLPGSAPRLRHVTFGAAILGGTAPADPRPMAERSSALLSANPQQRQAKVAAPQTSYGPAVATRNAHGFGNLAAPCANRLVNSSRFAGAIIVLIRLSRSSYGEYHGFGCSLARNVACAGSATLPKACVRRGSTANPLT